jgi:hypothetical protein
MRSSTRTGEHAPVNVFFLAVLPVAVTLVSLAVIRTADRGAAAWRRPGDATVAAAFTQADWPGTGETGVTVSIANPGSAPVLVGVSLRRALLPGGWPQRTVPRRTSRPRYQPTSQTAVAAVSPGTTGGLSVPVRDSRRYRLVVIIGQADGRLCVTSSPFRVIRLGGAAPAGSGTPPLPLP